MATKVDTSTVDTSTVDTSDATATAKKVSKYNTTPFYQDPPESALYITAAQLRIYTEQMKALVFDSMFPVGSLYIALSDIHPTYGTWEDVTATYEGRSLWCSSSNVAGTQLNGSLPNIQGTLSPVMLDDSSSWISNGAFYFGGMPRQRSWSGTNGDSIRTIGFQASNSNSIYNAAAGASVVRPTCITVKIYKRTA